MARNTLFLSVFLAGTLSARLLERDDFNHIVKMHIQKIHLHKNGQLDQHHKIKLQVTKEEGRKNLSSYTIPYNRATTKVKIINISVTNGEKDTVKPKPDQIVDTPIIARAHGFDAHHIVKIGLPKVRIGSVIDIEYTKTEKNSAFKDHFSDLFTFGLGNYEENKQIHITSFQKLHFQINDPWRVIHITDSKNHKGIFSLSIRSKRPFGKFSLTQGIQMDPKKLNFALVSTDTDWNKVTQNIWAAYEKVINSALPPTLNKIAQEAQRKITLIDKVNYSINQIIQKYNYLGDWRSTNGQFIPKSFIELERTQYGDCKDFSSALTAVLRKSGVNAHIAWVQRGHILMRKKIDSPLVYTKGFNHAIVYIKNSDKEYWVDPTNSYANGLTVNDDIALSEALVLNQQRSKLKMLPNIQWQDHIIEIHQSYNFKDVKKALSQGVIHISGRHSASIIQASRKIRRNKLEQNILSMVSVGEQKSVPVIPKFKLQGFINKKLSIPFKYASDNTTARKLERDILSLPIENSIVLAIKANIKNKLTHLWLGLPYLKKRRISFNNVHLIGNREPICDINSPWLSLKRSISQKEKSLFYQEEFILKQPFLTSKEFRSSDFTALSIQLKNCYSQNTLPIAMGKRQGTTNAQKLVSLFKNLPKKERIKKRYQVSFETMDAIGTTNKKNQYTLSDALSLMEANIAEDPYHENSYLLMARIIRLRGYISNSDFSTESESLVKSHDLLESAIKLLGRKPKFLLSQAKTVLLMNQDRQKAVSLITEAIAKEEKRDPQFLTMLAENYHKIQDDEKFLKIMKEYKKKAKDRTSLLKYELDLADFYSHKSNWKKCIEHYTNYLEQVPDGYFVHNKIGTCYREINKFDKSIASYEKTLSLVQPGTAKSGLIKTYVKKGLTLIFDKKFEDAKLTLHKALLVGPNIDAYQNLAVISFAEDNIDQGIEYIDKIIIHSNKYESREVALSEILTVVHQIAKDKISGFSDKLLEKVTTAKEKIFVATFIINNLYERKIFNQNKIDKLISLVSELENQNLISYDDNTKINLAQFYLVVAIMRNDLRSFDKAISLTQKIKKPKEFARALIPVKQAILVFDSRSGRQPASVYWKAKKKLHNFLQDKFEYDLINVGYNP